LLSKVSAALPLPAASLVVKQLTWSCLKYWTRNKEWGSWMMKELFSPSFVFSLASREWAYQ
jgi:hypothetical protein